MSKDTMFILISRFKTPTDVESDLKRFVSSESICSLSRAGLFLQKLEERFRISRRELISFEFTILVALEMALYLPESKVMPHFRRLVQQQQV